MDFSNNTDLQKKNKSLVLGAYVMGIISIISAFTCFSFLTPLVGGLGIIFALLSKGSDISFEKKAKRGLILSALSIGISFIFMLVAFFSTYKTLSQYNAKELYEYMNEFYEKTYGQSFDEMYEDIYGEDFLENYKDALDNISESTFNT